MPAPIRRTLASQLLNGRPLLIKSIVFIGLAGTGAYAFTASPADHYLDKVKPLLADKCVACHGPLRSESGLRLDAAVLIRKGAANESVVVEGKPDQSRLLQRVQTDKLDERMPPEGEGVALTLEELAILQKWISEGLIAPDNEKYVENPSQHWAYQPILRPSIPDALPDSNPDTNGKLTSDCSDGNAIDRLLGDVQNQHGLRRLGQADPATWLRRVTLDLNGLPPSPEEVDAFLADKSSDARSRVVERLLTRPAYGERWGRHWMDVWRYSDWDGFKEELRGSQRHIWHWRDWIIESLNANKPYDQMVVEMLAGDEIAPTDPQILRATGFLARNYHKSNRDIWLDATVEHTAKAFLGMTVACARCHDHKYDPISQDQYYQFRAIFEPHEVRTEQVAGQANVEAAGIPRVFDAKPDAPTYLLVRGNEKQPRKDMPMSPGVPGVLDLAYHCEPIPLVAQAYQPALTPIAEANAIEVAWQRLENARKVAEPLLHELREQARRDAQAGYVAPREETDVQHDSEDVSDDVGINSSTGEIKADSVGIAEKPTAVPTTEPVSKAEEKPEGAPAVAVNNSETNVTPANDAVAQAAAIKNAAVAQALDSPLDPVQSVLLETHAAEAALLALQARYRADHARADGLTEARLTPFVRRAALAEQRATVLEAQAAYVKAQRDYEEAETAAEKAAQPQEAAVPDPAVPAAENKVAVRKAKKKQVEKKVGGPLDLAEKNVQSRREVYAKAIEAAQVPAATYTPVGPVYPKESTGRRLALARWIVDPTHPLTARVAANQIWLRHFGMPMIDDVSDFGLRAKRPLTAPILDYLAAELIASGWDMKQLHRQIVLSQTYGLTSDTTSPDGELARSSDPENRLFARANVRRLDAEEIRDGLLAAADHLDRSAGGPDLSEDQGEKVPRRSVYFRHAYEKQVAMLVLFDGASPNECYRRSPSILPQQALALANSQLARDLSRRLGQNLHAQAQLSAAITSQANGQSVPAQASGSTENASSGNAPSLNPASATNRSANGRDFIDNLFVTVLSRLATDAERIACENYLRDASVGESDGTALLLARRQSLVHALLNHNDFVVAR